MRSYLLADGAQVGVKVDIFGITTAGVAVSFIYSLLVLCFMLTRRMRLKALPVDTYIVYIYGYPMHS